MTEIFTSLERRILTLIQWDFPLQSDPYGTLAAQMDCSRDEIFASIQRMRKSGVIRRIGGSFAPTRLGYVSVLAAACVEPSCLESAAALAASFPEVTHNYEREHRFNLWFTVIAASRERLEEILQTVRNCDGVIEAHGLPALKTFKIRVNFDLRENPGAAPDASVSHPSAGVACIPSAPYEMDDVDRRIIPRCCGDIGDSDRPFTAVARELDLPEAVLLERLASYRSAGVLRRFGAVLRHQRAGFSANGMSTWNVPDEDVTRAGQLMAGVPEISHCYERPRFPGWPYNLFAMIHATSRDRCLQIAADLSRAISTEDYRILFSIREFKKSSMIYMVNGKD